MSIGPVEPSIDFDYAYMLLDMAGFIIDEDLVISNGDKEYGILRDGRIDLFTTIGREQDTIQLHLLEDVRMDGDAMVVMEGEREYRIYAGERKDEIIEDDEDADH